MDDEKKGRYFLKRPPSLIKGFGIEILVVLLLGVIVLAGLVYFKVIDLNKLLDRPVTVDGKQYDITASSSVEGYTLSIKNKKELVNLLSEWGVYGKTFNGGYGLLGGTGNNPVTKINVYFVDQIQPINQFVTQEGEVYMSSVTKASGGELSVFIHLGKFVLDNPEYNNELWRQFDYLFLTTVYNLANRETRLGQNNAPNSPLQKYLTEKNQNSTQFFNLVRK